MSNEHGRINRLQEVEDLTEYINNGWLHSGESDGPTFLWNDMIREASQEDAENRNNVPVAQLSDADMVISMPMQWYFDSIAAMVPTAERTDTGVEIPRIDMPTFHLDSQALSGGRGGRQCHRKHTLAGCCRQSRQGSGNDRAIRWQRRRSRQ